MYLSYRSFFPITHYFSSHYKVILFFSKPLPLLFFPCWHIFPPDLLFLEQKITFYSEKGENNEQLSVPSLPILPLVMWRDNERASISSDPLENLCLPTHFPFRFVIFDEKN